MRRLAIIICSLLITLAAHAQDAAPLFAVLAGGSTAAIDTNLVAWYKLDGNTLDSSPNGHHGIWAANYEGYVSGKIGQCADFAKSTTSGNGTIDCSAPLLPATADWSLLFWTKTQTTEVQQNMITQFTAGNAGRTVLSMRINSGPKVLSLQIGGLVNSSVSTAINVWVHVGVRRVGTAVGIYTNGAFAQTITVSGSIMQTANTRLGGTGPTLLAYGYIGLMDDVRIYKRALSSGDFLRVYNGVSPIHD